MNIATYNIQQGGTRRVHWTKLIEEHLVDLLLVQESCSPDEHIPPLIFPDFREQVVWSIVARNGWGSGIFSRTGSMKPIPVPNFEGWAVGAEIVGAGYPLPCTEPLLVFSIHAPSTTESYSKQVNRILDEIATILAGRDCVLGGDFNLQISNGAASESPTSRANLAIQKRLADDFRLCNCWEAMHPNTPLHQTLRWKRNPSVPYHCDGIFVPQVWRDRLVSCEVLAGEAWNQLSDHNPVIARFS